MCYVCIKYITHRTPMAVKVLMRRPGPSIGSLPIGGPSNAVSAIDGLKGMLSGAADKIARFASGTDFARKSASGEALSFTEKVGEFIARNAPHIEPGAVAELLMKAKTPLLITLGVTAAAGLVYLAYKLYKHFTEKSARETVETIMADLRNVAPDILTVPGWEDQVKEDVWKAVNSGANNMVNEVARIKATLLDKQQKTNPKGMGAGINMFKHTPIPRIRATPRGKGAGMMTI